jgi:hypothetical protein
MRRGQTESMATLVPPRHRPANPGTSRSVALSANGMVTPAIKRYGLGAWK